MNYTNTQYMQCFDVVLGIFSDQGHSRRLQVCIKPVQNSGTLPLLVEAILSVSIGCVSARSTKLQRPLDSYQVCEIHTEIHTKYNNYIFISVSSHYKPTSFMMLVGGMS